MDFTTVVLASAKTRTKAATFHLFSPVFDDVCAVLAKGAGPARAVEVLMARGYDLTAALNTLATAAREGATTRGVITYN